ncbi:MAG: hypothetical protein HOC95_05115 [Candidatus Diapherotrites archaeon]|nr:hypothetical protein [Candidatus Diapherotrites archaeon]
MEFDLKNVKTKVWENKKMILILIVLFLFAMSIRSNIVRYEGNYLFEPDAYYHARLVEDIVTTGSVPNPDPLAYYQIGGSKAQEPSVYHWLSAVLYSVISLGAFSKELLMFSVQFFPIVFGALISVGMYFLGKEIFNSKKVGVITAFLAAVTPAFAYRTMAGAQGDNSLGFLWMVIGFIFLVRAVKKKELGRAEILNFVLAGVFFGIMSWTWSMYLLIPFILIPYFIFGIIQISSQQTDKKPLLKSEFFTFTVKVLGALGILTLMDLLYYSGVWFDGFIIGVNQIIPLGYLLISILTIIGILAVIGISFFVSKSSKDTKKLFAFLVIIGLYITLLAMFILFASVPDLVDRTTLASMVGEESTGSQFFGTKYNALIVFPWVALFAMPICLYFFRKKESHPQMIFWFWTIITLIMAWYKLKFTFVFGLGVVTGAAITVYLIFELLKKYDFGKGIEAKSIIIVTCFLLLLGVGAAAIFMPDYSPHANSNHEWIEAMDWITANTPEDAKLFNWWGEGHMISFITERRVSSDNRNYIQEANADYAKFLILPDTNEAYDIVSNKIGADYVILQSGQFNSLPTMEFYAAGKLDSPIDRKYYGTGYANCSGEDTLTCQGRVFNQYNTSFEISRAQLDSFSNWNMMPTDFYNGQIPIYFYKNTTNSMIILDATSNASNLAKVWFNSDETKTYYKEVFSNGNIKIFEIL